MGSHQEAVKVAQRGSQGSYSVLQQIGDDWVVEMEWPPGVTDGGPAKISIEPIGRMPVGGLSSTVLRRINFRDAIDNLHRQIAATDRRVDQYDAIKVFEREQLRAMSTRVSPEYLALLSHHYVRAAERGQANINEYLAELVDKPVGTVRGHLMRARRDGLLSGEHGKKGGQLSPEAEDLLEPYNAAWLAELERLRDMGVT